MKIDKLLFLFCIIFLISIASPAGYTEDDHNSVLIMNDNFELSFDDHDRIMIENNTDFAYQASIEGWEGDGNSSTPYIIEGYNITDDLTCIQIMDVTAYFTIRNCFINSSTTATDPAVYFYNASHARIEDTTITWHTYGIYANLCPDVVIDNCTITESNANTIWIINSDGAVLSDCEIYENLYRVFIESSNNVTIYNNEIYDNGYEGIYVASSDFVNITNNDFSNNGLEGIQYSSCDNLTIHNNEFIDNFAGGIYGVSISNFVTISNNTVCRNGGGSGDGFDISDGYNITIINNQIYENDYYGMELYDCYDGNVEGNSIYNNTRYGMYLYQVSEIEICDNDIWENGFRTPPSGGDLSGGMYVEDATESLIEDNRIWNNSLLGVFVKIDSNCSINNNMIVNNTRDGIYGSSSDDILVSNNMISGNSWDSSESYRGGIATEGTCNRWNITENIVHDNRYHGLHIYGYRMYISRNQVYNHNETGISTWMAINYTVSDNVVYTNNVGIFLGNNIEANVTGNILYYNDLGINLYGVANVVLHHNDFAWNTKNAEEFYPNNNSWNDTTLTGNWWSDFNGTGSYGITNTTDDVVNYDNYPHKSLDLNASANLGYEFGDTGNVMVWPAQALNPSHYEVYVDGSLHSSDSWDGSDITASLDSFEVGSYEIMVIAYHISGHSMNATSPLTVIDTTGPVWGNAPTSQQITFGQPFSYQISAIDLSGIGSYNVNDTVNFHISETGLITNTTTLEIGTYGLEITVADNNGNELTISISITVVAATDTTTTSTGTGPPGDSTLLLILGAGAAVGVIFVVLIVFMKKKG